MQVYRLALIGYGNVGQGFAQLLYERGAELAQQYNVHFEIVAVSTRSRGSIYDPLGFPPATILHSSDFRQIKTDYRDWDNAQIIRESNAHIILELTPTDVETSEPALSHIRMALNAGKHVVTANKGPIALHYPELKALAAANGVQIGVEGTVMSGTPALNLGTQLLQAAGIQRIQGIINGTTNYILTQMELGKSYAEALAEAQALGYAEADPTGDVEGHDAAVKVVILAGLLMGANLTLADVTREGITRLTVEDIRAAQAAQERWKLIGTVEKTAEGIQTSVKPTRLPLTHPLAHVNGALNAITYSTHALGDVTLIGVGAGRMATGYALLLDLLGIHASSKPTI